MAAEGLADIEGERPARLFNKAPGALADGRHISVDALTALWPQYYRPGRPVQRFPD
jgi:hypothetical protein